MIRHVRVVILYIRLIWCTNQAASCPVRKAKCLLRTHLLRGSASAWSGKRNTQISRSDVMSVSLITIEMIVLLTVRNDKVSQS